MHQNVWADWVSEVYERKFWVEAETGKSVFHKLASGDKKVSV
jgi:hypothetical protein